MLLRRSSENVPVPAVRPEVSPLPLTPADVHNVVFKKPPIGKRGYDEDEVDAFLDVVEAELARLIEENNELRAGHSPGSRVEEHPESVASGLTGIASVPVRLCSPAPYYDVTRGEQTIQ